MRRLRLPPVGPFLSWRMLNRAQGRGSAFHLGGMEEDVFILDAELLRLHQCYHSLESRLGVSWRDSGRSLVLALSHNLPLSVALLAGPGGKPGWVDLSPEGVWTSFLPSEGCPNAPTVALLSR